MQNSTTNELLRVLAHKPLDLLSMAPNMSGAGEERYVPSYRRGASEPPQPIQGYRRRSTAPPPPPSSPVTHPHTPPHASAIDIPPQPESASPRAPAPIPTIELTPIASREGSPVRTLPELRHAPLQDVAPLQDLPDVPTAELTSIPSNEIFPARYLHEIRPVLPRDETPAYGHGPTSVSSSSEVRATIPFQAAPQRQPVPEMYVPPPQSLPPELERLYMQCQEPHRQQSRIISDATQFRDVALYIDTGVDPGTQQPVLLDLKCPCCGYHLDVPARVSPNMFPDAPIEPLAVLPCGHMIGSHCLDNWTRRRDEERELPNCPICRFELVYRVCGCLLRIREYDPRLSRAEQLPFTLSEGGSVSENCGPCRDRHADTALRVWLDENLPANSAQGSLTRAQQRRVQACVWGLARQARNWHRENAPRW
ncbi:hypothetical protein PG990_009640 [Apiospora arundinis]|uniref:RING-type domain-containing protein n=1 Tax=Apiospora arundinis TaxID=335852 RepID=A0ABR2IU09_9PEZI